MKWIVVWGISFMILQKASTDWLASRNIFYNTRTKQISDDINELIEPEYIEFHPEGLRNYLDYGYSVFGQTPLKDIKFLLANSTIEKRGKELIIEKRSDPFEKFIGIKSNVSDTLDLMKETINSWEKNTENVIIPLSGGFDSRIIANMLNNRENVRAYTYGISEKQKESMEVVYAKKLCELLKIKWEQIELGDFFNYTDDWYKLYGVSTHAHGMYQMEFYDKIQRRRNKSYGSIISGIYGDLWAGGWKFELIDSPDKVINLGITHGLCADSNFCKLEEVHDLRNDFFLENREKLQEQNWRIVIAARMKIILLSYLLRIPEYFGLNSWSPFLNFEIVCNMLNLDWKDKERRKWQVEYFKKNEILIGEMGLKYDRKNVLDICAWRNAPLPELDVKLLEQIVEKDYILKINAQMKKYTLKNEKYFWAYTVLWPLQKLLRIKEYGE